MNVYSIVFKKNGKAYYFNGHEIDLETEDMVIVETEKGQQLGKVVTKISDQKTLDSVMNLKDILRKASEEDFNKHLKNLNDSDKALKKAEELSKELKLSMTFLDANYTFDRKQLLFNFIADGRVDFRELAKSLASIYRTRIELRQIGVRDKAKEVGGIGQCGRELCCASFLNHMDTVSINMAKNQNIALNPTKINGTCGRLLCCLAYEDDLYTESQKDLPCVGNKIRCCGKLGTVKSINILNKSYKVECDGEIKTVEIDKDDKSIK